MSDYVAAFGTVDVEAVRVIFPTADLGAFLWKDMATPGTAIIIPANSPPGKKPLEKIWHPHEFSKK